MFDEIDSIKDADTFVAPPAQPEAEEEEVEIEIDEKKLTLQTYDFTLEDDLPEQLRPVSFILQAVRQLEDLKEKLRPQAEI